jgi:hypothetical protein
LGDAKVVGSSVTAKTSATGVVLHHLFEAYVAKVNDFVSMDIETGKSVDGGDGLADFLSQELQETAEPDDGTAGAVRANHDRLLCVIDEAIADLQKLRLGCLNESTEMTRLMRSRETEAAVSSAVAVDGRGSSRKSGPSPM